jgi:hypothetical protein
MLLPAADGCVPIRHFGEGKYMPNNRLLSYALIVFGVAFCLIYPLSMFWPSGWAWHDGPPASNDYFMMIVGVYATLGVFMILASRNPMMAGHLYGDVPALILIAVVLGYLTLDRPAARAAM